MGSGFAYGLAISRESIISYSCLAPGLRRLKHLEAVLTSLLFLHGLFAWILLYSSLCAAKILSEQIAASEKRAR